MSARRSTARALERISPPCAGLRCAKAGCSRVDIRYAGQPGTNVRDEEPVWDRAAMEWRKTSSAKRRRATC
jgi:sRNA-binding protein